METIGVKELMKGTGLTYRQIDYWCRKGVIDPINSETVSIGFAREFDANIVERVRTLSTISTACKNRLSLEILREIYDNFDNGHIYLAPGVVLKWRTSDDNEGPVQDASWHTDWKH